MAGRPYETAAMKSHRLDRILDDRLGRKLARVKVTPVKTSPTTTYESIPVFRTAATQGKNGRRELAVFAAWVGAAVCVSLLALWLATITLV